MSRPESVDTLMLHHITWENDSLVIQEQGGKGDQAGKGRYDKHCYDNLELLHINVVLALAFIVFLGDHRDASRMKLFHGTNNKNRYNQCLHSIFETLTDEERGRVGCTPEELGSYSIRKGSSTYCNSHSGLVTYTQVQLRMGHSLGKVNDCYISQEAEIDYVLGKIVAGRNSYDRRFGELPPHFDAHALEKLTPDLWRQIVPSYDEYPTQFRPCFPFLLATIIHNESVLREKLCAQHPLWTCAVFTRNSSLSDFRNHTLTGIMLSQRGLQATGVPRDLILAEQIHVVGSNVASMQTNLATMPTQIAEATVAAIREHVEITGMHQLTIQDIRSVFAEHTASLIAPNVNEIAPPNSAAGPTILRGTSWWGQWSWHDGKLDHFVPLGWRFPSGLTMIRMAMLWFMGNWAEQIRPYRLLHRDDLATQDKMQYTRAAKVAEEIVVFVNRENLLVGSERIGTLTSERFDEILPRAITALLRTLLTEAQMSWRPQDTTYGTCYNLIIRARKTQLQVEQAAL